MSSAAKNQGFGGEDLERYGGFMPERKSYKFQATSEVTNQLYPALFAAQLNYPSLEKTKTGSTGNRNYQYADLAVIMEAIRKPNADQGLFIVHTSHYIRDIGGLNGSPFSETRIIHAHSGQWIAAILPLYGVQDQKMGISTTYARRYCTLGLTGIVGDEDTDGLENVTSPELVAVQDTDLKLEMDPPVEPTGLALDVDSKPKSMDLNDDARVIAFTEFITSCTDLASLTDFWGKNTNTLNMLHKENLKVYDTVNQVYMQKVSSLFLPKVNLVETVDLLRHLWDGNVKPLDELSQTHGTLYLELREAVGTKKKSLITEFQSTTQEF